MKKFLPLLIIIFTAALAHAAPPTIRGPVQVTIHGVGQALSGVQISAKTNTMGSTTNVVDVFKSTTTNFTMDADSLFALLENSFHTNFPAGCRLLFAKSPSLFPLYAFVVSDTTGTNAGFDPSQVLSSSFLNGVRIVGSGLSTETFKSTPGGEIDTERDVISHTEALTFTYDDSAMTNTTDGTFTKFTWVGLLHNKSTALSIFETDSNFYNETITMDVVGTGSIRFPADAGPLAEGSAMFTGSIQAKVSGH